MAIKKANMMCCPTIVQPSLQVSRFCFVRLDSTPYRGSSAIGYLISLERAQHCFLRQKREKKHNLEYVRFGHRSYIRSRKIFTDER